MENLNIVEILKLGLPGLVFLLSMLSYRLLSKEEEKQHPSHDILSSIKLFMSINVVLAVLTLVSPILDYTFFKESKSSKPFNIEAKIGVASLEQGKAEVCHDAEYKNRYLLVSDKKTEKLVQVFASSLIPCTETKQIRLTEKDTNLLGWNTGTSSSMVEVVAASPGYKFVTN